MQSLIFSFREINSFYYFIQFHGIVLNDLHLCHSIWACWHVSFHINDFFYNQNWWNSTAFIIRKIFRMKRWTEPLKPKKQPGQWVRAKSKMLLLVLVQPAENFFKSTKVETECCILNVERRENCNICSCLVLDRTIMMIWLWIDSFILSNAVISGLWTVVSEHNQ